MAGPRPKPIRSTGWTNATASSMVAVVGTAPLCHGAVTTDFIAGSPLWSANP